MPAFDAVGSPREIHPATNAVLIYFDYGHLPPDLARVASPFRALAHDMAKNQNLDGPELTVGLRKLLEAKDCMVRAAL